MLIAAASDAHGARAYREALVAALPKIDAFCYLGDCEADGLALRLLLGNTAFHIVRGNCDHGSDLPETVMERLDGVRALITHGHRFHVKRTTALLAAKAAEQGCALALFGHTHQPYHGAREGVVLVNPGALCMGRYALIDTETLAVRLLTLSPSE